MNPMKSDERPDMEQATGTQLLDRTVGVIKFLGEFGEKGARMSEIAEGLGLKTSTAATWNDVKAGTDSAMLSVQKAYEKAKASLP